MTYSTFIDIVEVVWVALALAGFGLGLYLLRAERRDRALTIAENGRTGILSRALVLAETLRVISQVTLFIVGIFALATPNLTDPPTALHPYLILIPVMFAGMAVMQSTILIYARQRIARYVAPPAVEGARQDTLIEVQQDVGRVYEKAHDVDEKIADLTNRTTASELRADEAQERADVSERRADAAEERES